MIIWMVWNNFIFLSIKLNLYNMKKIILLMFAVISVANSYSQCSKTGDSQKTKLQVLDTLKNRNYVSNVVNTNITLDKILIAGDDVQRYKSTDYASFKAYVYDVKHGGSETRNCHSKNQADMDIHVELVLDLNSAGKTGRMIVEVNRYTQAQYPEMSYKNIHKLIGKYVQVDGWMFFDEEHKQNAYNTNPKGTTIWRATCWEIHPLMNIVEIK